MIGVLSTSMVIQYDIINILLKTTMTIRLYLNIGITLWSHSCPKPFSSKGFHAGINGRIESRGEPEFIELLVPIEALIKWCGAVRGGV